MDLIDKAQEAVEGLGEGASDAGDASGSDRLDRPRPPHGTGR